MSDAAAHEFLAGGGEMGARMRAHDWSQTALGPIDRWPQSLRTTVSTCLNSRFPILVWWGPDLVKLYNDAYAPILGNKHPHALGGRGRDVWPEIWHIIGPMLEGVLERGEATWSENQFLPLVRHGFAEECYFTFSYSPIRDESNRVGGVFCAVTETTRQVLGERRLRTLTDLSNRTLAATSPGEACELARAILAENKQDIPSSRIELLEHDRVRTELTPSPSLVLDDSYRNFLDLVAGHVDAAVARARALEEARERAEALAALDRAKTAFFSNVSHEFRTPLTLMLGPLEEALASTPPVLAGANLETMYRNAQRLLKLVNALLDFSRIEAGRARASYEPVDLAEVTAELASVFRSAVESADLRFEVHCEPLGEPVFVDREMWEKIVLNLLSNALKFTFDGEIAVALRREGERAVLTVRDTGTGIPQHELPRVFERFHRIAGARARTHEGSGIGLALVQELVRMHGGEITATSELGAGTTFTIAIPFGMAHLPADRIADMTPRPVSSRSAFIEEALRWVTPDAREDPPATADPTTTLLVVDDNADMREYVARLLRTRWSVVTAGDGEQALAAARAHPPALVLTDVMMPRVDGFRLLRMLRDDPVTRSVPVIMLSARAGEEARIEGLQAGADDYVIKPFSARELIARVATHLSLRQLRARLELERGAMAKLFEHCPVPVAIIRGPELVFELANRAYVDVVGGREVVGKAFFDALPEAAGQGFDDLLRQVMTTGTSYVGHETLVRLVRERELRDLYFTFIYSPLAAVRPEERGVVVICNDVTEQVEARRRVEQLAADAQAASRAKDEFLAMLGHELRNPLAPMQTALELMRLRGVTSREHAVLERQVGHMSRLVDDLLDVSRVTRGKIELRKQPVELADVVARAVEIAGPLIEQRRNRLELDVPARGLRVEADRDRMAQVIANLVTNAAKYSDEGSRIGLAAARTGERIELRIRDEGVGIAPEMLDRVFDMFVQERQSIDRSQGGLGLGLAIARSLVELHGGTIRAHSDGLGRGTEMIVSLAACDAQVSAAAEAPNLPPASSRMRVLVVDDNVDAATMLVDVLAQLGYHVESASDGPAALEKARAFRPNIALVDIGLPVMDGYELARQLRDAHELHLVAVTGYGQDTDRRRAAEAGFDRHLVKPVNLAALAGLVEELGRVACNKSGSCESPTKTSEDAR